MNTYPSTGNRLRRSGSRLLLAVVGIVWMSGCGLFGGSGNAGDPVPGASKAEPEIVRYTGEKSKVIPYVYTAKRELSLTFNGMGDDKTMKRLLDELDRYGIKATFFLPGMRVAEEPDVAKEIVARGHEIENNTLNRLDLTKLGYEKIYKEIQLSNEIIRRETGMTPQYVRTRSGDYNDDVRLAAAHNGLKGVVGYSLFLHNWQSESEQEKYLYVRKHITRGGIINIDTEEDKALLEAVPMLARAAEDVGYSFIPVSKLIAHGGIRKPLEEIKGYDAIKLNPNYGNAKYNLISSNRATRNKEVALTFDDWGTDYTVTKILDILEKYDVKATFFLRANGVEANPNLARAILEAGHDVANHSYSHPVVTTLTPEQLQNDILKAHQVITEAIQQQPTMLFRPPTGEIDDKTAKIISAIGFPNIALYDVTTFDWDDHNSAKDIENNVINQTQNGSVILLHMLDDIHTIEALPIVIERLKKKGYALVKMADLIGLNQ
ncbi:polysaccharide deacetylase family protein [Cohnella nanjingensis]|uniref:Polysaccharide deacetylase family protein n=1 Tax=Cohnella nanjingensis TaxID=1387779 RepID=A0A7X0VHV3_9BACL|nr:polysaccharide deacetylase family protein [Cohnella nanjingensis]MBB6674542.1 polysaccharide deacetylase family protein [Cohnella nanjingensis]